MLDVCFEAENADGPQPETGTASEFESGSSPIRVRFESKFESEFEPKPGDESRIWEERIDERSQFDELACMQTRLVTLSQAKWISAESDLPRVEE